MRDETTEDPPISLTEDEVTSVVLHLQVVEGLQDGRWSGDPAVRQEATYSDTLIRAVDAALWSGQVRQQTKSPQKDHNRKQNTPGERFSIRPRAES
jgi:hypothetical protein